MGNLVGRCIGGILISVCESMTPRTRSLSMAYVYLILQVVVAVVLIASVREGQGDMRSHAALARGDDEQTARVDPALGAYIGLAYSLLSAIFAILLLVGLYKNKRGCVKAFIVHLGIFVVAAIAYFIYCVTVGMSAEHNVVIFLCFMYSTGFLVQIILYYRKMNNTEVAVTGPKQVPIQAAVLV